MWHLPTLEQDRGHFGSAATKSLLSPKLAKNAAPPPPPPAGVENEKCRVDKKIGNRAGRLQNIGSHRVIEQAVGDPDGLVVLPLVLVVVAQELLALFRRGVLQ